MDVSEKKVLNDSSPLAMAALRSSMWPFRVDAMLQAVQLPTSIADLHAGLAHVDGNTLTLPTKKERKKKKKGQS